MLFFLCYYLIKLSDLIFQEFYYFLLMKVSKEQRIKDIINIYKIWLSNSEIAEELEIKLTTVKNYMKRYIRTREDYNKKKGEFSQCRK